MLRSSWGGVRSLATACALWLLAIAGACGEHTRPETRGGETHWLSSCARDSDCGEAGMCLCGICSAACDVRDACERDSVAADCRPIDAPALAERCSGLSAGTRAICIAVCDANTRCPSGTSCEDGACLPASSAVTGPDGGPIGDGGEVPDATGMAGTGALQDGAPAPAMDGGIDATVDGSADGAMPDPNQPVIVTLPPPDAPSPSRPDTCDYGRPDSDVVHVASFNFGPPAIPIAFEVTESAIFATQHFATECVSPPACTYEARLFRIPRCGGDAVAVGGPWPGLQALIGMSAGRAYLMRWDTESVGFSEVDVSSGEAIELFATDRACIAGVGRAVSEDHVVLSDSCQDKLLLLSRTAMRFEPIADVIDPGAVAIGTNIAYVATPEGVRWVVLTSGETGLLTDLKNVFTLSADEHAVLASSEHTSATGTPEHRSTLIELDGGAVRTWTGEQLASERVPVLVADGYVYSRITTSEGKEVWKTPSADSTASPRRIMRRDSGLLRPFGERLYWIERRNDIMTTVEQADRALHEEELPVWSERFTAHNNPLQMTAALAPNGDIVAVTTTEGRVDLGGGEVSVPFDRAVLARFDRQGELRWQKVVEGQSLSQQIAVAPDGTIGLAGVEHVSRLSAEGDPIFTQPLPRIFGRLLAVDGAGGTYLAELEEGGASALVALDAAGDERWRRTLTLEGPNAPGVLSLAAGAAGALVAIVGRGSRVDLGDGPIDADGYGTYVALFGPDGTLRFWRLIEGAAAGAQFGPDGIVAIGRTDDGVPQAGEQYAFTLPIDLDGTVHTPRTLDIDGAEQGRVTADGDVYFLARGASRPVPALVQGAPVFTGSDVYQPYLVVHVTRDGVIDWTGLVAGAESVTLSADERGAVVGGIIRQDFLTIDGLIAAYE